MHRGAQVLLRFNGERRWLRAAAKQAGHLFPRLLRQSEYNTRLKAAAPLMEASLRRELETGHPVMITAVKRPAGETRGKVLRDLTPGMPPRQLPTLHPGYEHYRVDYQEGQ